MDDYTTPRRGRGKKKPEQGDQPQPATGNDHILTVEELNRLWEVPCASYEPALRPLVTLARDAARRGITAQQFRALTLDPASRGMTPKQLLDAMLGEDR